MHLEIEKSLLYRYRYLCRSFTWEKLLCTKT